MKFGKERIMKPWSNNDGYLFVNLYIDNKSFRMRVHRLVLITFKGHPQEGQETNHIDGIKTNNAIDNLEWVTKSENARHAFANGLRTLPTLKGENNSSSKLTKHQVIEIRQRLKAGELQREIASDYDVSRTTISKIKLGEKWAWLKAV